MADIDKAEMAVDVLTHLCVISSTQTPSDKDQALAEKAIDAEWSELRGVDLATFPLTAIPPWAQRYFRATIALNLAPSFGITGQRLIDLEREAGKSEYKLNRQTAGKKQKRVRRGVYF